MLQSGMAHDTLTSLRQKSGLTIPKILERAVEHDPDFPTTHAGYLGIEERGTKDYWKILALAAVFGTSMEGMADIVKPKPCPKKV